MTQHHVVHKTIAMKNLESVNISYWCDETTVYVAAFDQSGHRVSTVTYSAMVNIAEDFNEAFMYSLIDGLVKTAETDLMTNPKMYYRPQTA